MYKAFRMNNSYTVGLPETANFLDGMKRVGGTTHFQLGIKNQELGILQGVLAAPKNS